MRGKTIEMLNKIQNELIKREYLTADEISKLCNFGIGSAYRSIKLLRLQGIGVIPTNKGYVLSEYAKKKDDIQFIRRLYGRRTNDLLSLQTSEKDIKKRWRGVEDKNNIKHAMEYFLSDYTSQNKASNSIKYLISSVNGKGN